MNENNNTSNEKEIDLLDVLRKVAKYVGQCFSYCQRLAGMAILFTVRKSLWLFAFLCIGLAIAFAQYNASKRYYSSTLTARVNVLDNTFFVNAFSELQGLTPHVLARTLQIPDSVAEQVRSIAAFYGIDLNRDGIADMVDYKNEHRKHVRDSLFWIVPKEVHVRVEVYDESSFETLRKSVVNFINSTDHVNEHNHFRLYRLDQELVEVNTQIRRLDSLQRFEYMKSARENSLKLGKEQLLVLGEKERQLFHSQIFELQRQRLKIESEKQLYPGATTIIQDFLPLAKATNTFLFYAQKWIPLFLILGLLCATVWQYRKQLWDLVKNKHY